MIDCHSRHAWVNLYTSKLPVTAVHVPNEHRRTAVRRPQSNGIVERLHKTLLDEHFRIKGRIKFCEGAGEMQTDLDEHLKIYHQDHAHRGRNMNGRAPLQAFLEGLPPPEKEVQEA